MASDFMLICVGAAIFCHQLQTKRLQAFKLGWSVYRRQLRRPQLVKLKLIHQLARAAKRQTAVRLAFNGSFCVPVSGIAKHQGTGGSGIGFLVNGKAALALQNKDDLARFRMDMERFNVPCIVRAVNEVDRKKNKRKLVWVHGRHSFLKG